MKLITKYLSMLAAIFLVAASTQAQTTNVSLSTGTNQVIIGSYQLFTLVAASGTNSVTIDLYDNAQTNITYTNAQYITQTTVSTNVTVIFTNSVGNIQTNKYPGQWTYSVTNAANTNTLPILQTFVLTPNTSITRTVDMTVIKGLVAKASSSNSTLAVTFTALP